MTQTLIKILKTRKPNESITKDRREEFFDMDILFGTPLDNGVTPIERTKASINN